MENLEVSFDDMVNSNEAMAVTAVSRVGGRAAGGREAGVNGGLFLGGAAGLKSLLANPAGRVARIVPEQVYFRRDELEAGLRRGGTTEKVSLGLIYVPAVDTWRDSIVASRKTGTPLIEAVVGRAKADAATLSLLTPTAGDWYLEINGVRRDGFAKRLIEADVVLEHVRAMYKLSDDALAGAADLTDSLDDVEVEL